VISRLPKLTTLDSTPISDKERIEANRVYSSLPAPPAPKILIPEQTESKPQTPPPVDKHTRKKKSPRKKSKDQSKEPIVPALPIFFRRQ